MYSLKSSNDRTTILKMQIGEKVVLKFGQWHIKVVFECFTIGFILYKICNGYTNF